jgi:hypothetical protein
MSFLFRSETDVKTPRALAGSGGGRENNIDVGCRALVAASGEGCVSACQEVVNAVGVERTQ